MRVKNCRKGRGSLFCTARHVDVSQGPVDSGSLGGACQKRVAKHPIRSHPSRKELQLFLPFQLLSLVSKCSYPWSATGFRRSKIPATLPGECLTPPGANPLVVAERTPRRSSQSCVTGGQQPIGNPYRFLSFLLHTWQPVCDPNSHSWGRLFQLPGG